MGETINDRENEIIISYLPEKEDPMEKKKIIRKLFIALITSTVYLIVFELLFSDLIELTIGVILVLFLLIFPLSFIADHKSIQRKLFQIPLSFIVQVLLPTVIVLPFEHFYGIMTFSVLFTGLIHLILDLIFVKSTKS
ncbi:hypothetical protein PASE110613_17780 [Paenibacillus sediminis]|uniref:Small-conductance mechanosensitive channel n=1 Tax=Paenibacillus sediminis TaxID=664909 RepID=A0ABS4H9F3_9BACL|nr:hypothetical protein [Paenibacillus sediminis]MBP1938680.1 small-conductance mechanosensitive channel [Paenibacillus sediminis]